MGNTRKRYKRKIRLINFIAELIGSAIFSLLYFVFISRYLSEDYHMGTISLGLLIGAAYFAGVYIPFYTYRIHIIPFISIIRSLQKKKLSILYYKLPAQFIGAFMGTFIFSKFNLFLGDGVDILSIWVYNIENDVDLLFFNGLTVFVLCYMFYVIQLIFKNMGFTSTFFYAFVIQVVFIFSAQVSQITALNVFGYVSLSIIEGSSVFQANWLLSILTHFLVPSLVAYLIYFYIRDRYVERASKKSSNRQMI